MLIKNVKCYQQGQLVAHCVQTRPVLWFDPLLDLQSVPQIAVWHFLGLFPLGWIFVDQLDCYKPVGIYCTVLILKKPLKEDALDPNEGGGLLVQ